MTARRRGYTLFEVILVMALLVVLAAIAYPSFESMAGDFRMKAAGDAVRGGCARARSQAVNEGRSYRLAVVPNEGKYRIAPLSASGAATNANASGPTDSSSASDDTLPKGVTFGFAEGDSGSGADAEGYTTVAVFLPDGTAREDKEFLLNGRDSRPLVVKIRALTGVVTVQRQQAERGQP